MPEIAADAAAAIQAAAKVRGRGDVTAEDIVAHSRACGQTKRSSLIQGWVITYIVQASEGLKVAWNSMIVVTDLVITDLVTDLSVSSD